MICDCRALSAFESYSRHQEFGGSPDQVRGAALLSALAPFGSAPWSNWTSRMSAVDCYATCGGGCSRNAAMPVLAYFAVTGSVLIALLFLADATLERSNSPVIVTSQRSGLPETPQPPEAVQTFGSAPAPDMNSPAVLSAQPEPGSPAKIHPNARAARAEALPGETRFGASAKRARAEAPPANRSVPWHTGYRQNQFDRFSIKEN